MVEEVEERLYLLSKDRAKLRHTHAEHKTRLVSAAPRTPNGSLASYQPLSRHWHQAPPSPCQINTKGKAPSIKQACPAEGST